MAAPDNPLVCKVSLLFTRDTRTLVNTFHVARGSAWDLAGMTNLATLFVNWWNSSYKAYSAAQVLLREVQVRKLDPDDPIAVDMAVSPPSAGTAAGSPDTAATTQTASWRTGYAGRKFRGRMYAVGTTETFTNNDDSVNSTGTTTLTAAAGQLLSNLALAALQLVIFHKIDNTFTPVLTAIVENLVDSQRRRLANRGT